MYDLELCDYIRPMFFKFHYQILKQIIDKFWAVWEKTLNAPNKFEIIVTDHNIVQMKYEKEILWQYQSDNDDSSKELESKPDITDRTLQDANWIWKKRHFIMNIPRYSIDKGPVREYFSHW